MNAVSNPVATFNTIKTAILESYERDMVNGDANSRAHWVAYALGTVATSIVGAKGANALVKTGTPAANARHLFYGISMLDKYDGVGKKKWYMVFGLCDEAFAINSSIHITKHVDKGWVMFFVTLLNHSYWVLGAALGGIFGSFINFNTEGLEFVMTALFVVIFIENWMKEENHISSFIGVAASIGCLMIFGESNFIIPAMIAILVLLTLNRRTLEKAEVNTI